MRETEEDGRKVWKEEISAGKNGRRERGNEKKEGIKEKQMRSCLRRDVNNGERRGKKKIRTFSIGRSIKVVHEIGKNGWRWKCKEKEKMRCRAGEGGGRGNKKSKREESSKMKNVYVEENQ